MLSMSDTPIERFAPVFARLNTPVAFLVPTPTGYKKSIMITSSSFKGPRTSASSRRFW